MKKRVRSVWVGKRGIAAEPDPCLKINRGRILARDGEKNQSGKTVQLEGVLPGQ